LLMVKMLYRQSSKINSSRVTSLYYIASFKRAE
jgi:hypothetical protein